jgi:hypothetical protein
MRKMGRRDLWMTPISRKPQTENGEPLKTRHHSGFYLFGALAI